MAITVIAIVVIAGLAYYFLVVRPAGVSIYPGAVENAEATAELNMQLKIFENMLIDISGIEAKVYTAAENMGTIASWYRSKMAELGWTKQFDNVYETATPPTTFLLFKRGDDGALVDIRDGRGFTIVSGKWETVVLMASYWTVSYKVPAPPT